MYIYIYTCIYILLRSIPQSQAALSAAPAGLLALLWPGSGAAAVPSLGCGRSRRGGSGTGRVTTGKPRENLGKT